jgi:hypothetical protein
MSDPAPASIPQPPDDIDRLFNVLISLNYHRCDDIVAVRGSLRHFLEFYPGYVAGLMPMIAAWETYAKVDTSAPEIREAFIAQFAARDVTEAYRYMSATRNFERRVTERLRQSFICLFEVINAIRVFEIWNAR